MPISNRRFLAAVIPLFVVAVSGIVLAGCGSGNGTSTFTPNASQTGGSTNGGTTGGTPSPTPTPSGATPTPRPSSTPTPTPSPTASTGLGSGTLTDYYNGFSSNSNDTFTYKFTNTDTQAPDPNGSSGTTTNQSTIKGGILFGAGSTGQKTTVTITLPVSGSKTVTRQEEINTTNGTVFGYTYYTEDSSGRTDYGDDSVSNGVVTSSTRYDNGERTPFSLAPGQNYSQTFTVYETDFDLTGKVTSQYRYAQQEKITFVGVETTTVVGGTYSNVAHLRSEVSYTRPAAETGTTDQPTVETSDIYLSKFVGLVLSTNRTVTQNQSGTVNTTGAAYTYTDTDDGRDELVSATVGGTNYPPGRAAASVGGTLPKRPFLFPHRH